MEVFAHENTESIQINNPDPFEAPLKSRLDLNSNLDTIEESDESVI